MASSAAILDFDGRAAVVEIAAAAFTSAWTGVVSPFMSDGHSYGRRCCAIVAGKETLAGTERPCFLDYAYLWNYDLQGRC